MRLSKLTDDEFLDQFYAHHPLPTPPPPIDRHACCKNGHPYAVHGTTHTTKSRGYTYRVCRLCEAARQRAWQARRAARQTLA